MRTLAFLFLLIPSLLCAKIYDCFPFFNELELLQIRLGELNDIVDYFVLVESVETQRGKPKKLYFAENKHLFAPYLGKIIHVVVNERHPEYSMWEREHYQRNCILRGLVGCNDKDLILISDLDEIPRKRSILTAIHSLRNGKEMAYSFQMPEYQFHLNRKVPNRWIFGTVATTYKKLRDGEPQFFRRKNTKWPLLSNAGWHFTWLGGKDRIRQKMLSVVEGRDSIKGISDEEIDGWLNAFPIVPIDNTFPLYIQEHVDELIDLGLIATSCTTLGH